MPSKRSPTKTSSSGVLATSEKVVNAGAAKLRSGVNSVGRSIGQLTEYLEGPFTLTVIVLVIVLGIYAVVKLWKYESCKVSQRMDAASINDVLQTHVTKVVNANEHGDVPFDADATCAVSLQYLRAISGSYGGKTANSVYNHQNSEGRQTGTVDEHLEATIGDAIKHVRYFCDSSRISDQKLNSCDALEAWASENRVRSYMDPDTQLAPTYGAQALARADKDASFKSKLTGQSLTEDASYSDTDAKAIASRLITSTSLIQGTLSAELQSYQKPLG